MDFVYPPTKGFTKTLEVKFAPWLKIPFTFPGPAAPFTIDVMLRVEEEITENGGFLANIEENDTFSGDGLNIYLRSEAGSAVHFGVANDYSRAGTLSVGTWHQLTLVYDGGSAGGGLYTYLDDVLIGTATHTSGLLHSGTSYLHGHYNGTTALPAPATMANLRIWDYAKDAAGVSALQGTAHPADDPGLLLAIAFDSNDYFEQGEMGNWAIKLGALTGAFDNGAGKGYVGMATATLPDGQGLIRETQGILERELTPLPSYHGQIRGVVTVKGDPAAQRVLAFVRATGKNVAETTSAADGSYTLTGLDPEAAHYVVALDKNLEYNGVIADNIVPEVPA